MTTKGALTVLFVCTHNSGRSQIAEALLARKGKGRFVCSSAGSEPASAVHPLALRALSERGIEWRGRPKGFGEVADAEWDFVITLCDRAKEACPVFPGRPVYAHWGIPDPSEVTGDEAKRLRGYEDALTQIGARIDLMLALPQDQLHRAALEQTS